MNQYVVATTIGWPLALVAVFVLIVCAVVLSTIFGGRAAVASERVKGDSGEQFRQVAADYETLARETRDLGSAIQAELAALRAKVDSIEAMMRDVA
jgi:ABC-type multidrug transport system fused ATPase/permease subunit